VAFCLKGLLGTGLSKDRFRQPDRILLRIPEKLKTKCVSGSCLPGKYLCSPHYFRFVVFFIGHLFYTALFFRYARDPDGSGKVVIDGLTVCCIAMAWLFYGIGPAIYPK